MVIAREFVNNAIFKCVSYFFQVISLFTKDVCSHRDEKKGVELSGVLI